MNLNLSQKHDLAAKLENAMLNIQMRKNKQPQLFRQPFECAKFHYYELYILVRMKVCVVHCY